MKAFIEICILYIYIHTHSKKWDKTMTSGLNDLRTHLILSLILAPAMGDPSDPILQAHQWAHCAVAHVNGTRYMGTGIEWKQPLDSRLILCSVVGMNACCLLLHHVLDETTNALINYNSFSFSFLLLLFASSRTGSRTGPKGPRKLSKEQGLRNISQSKAIANMKQTNIYILSEEL